jgi:hypothetical protein
MRHLLPSLLPSVLLIAGCGEDPSPQADVGGPDLSQDAGDVDDTGTDTATADVETCLGPYLEGEQYILENSHVNVLRRLVFSAPIESGVAIGFDLDGRTSAPGDDESCNHGDQTDPEGRDGIDNQFSILWGAIEPIVGVQVEELLQGAINEGLVLVMMEITDFESLSDDDEATFNLYRGSLDPQVGTRGVIAPDQTFYYDYSAPLSSALATITNGELFAGPVELGIPITILDLDIILPLKNGFVRIQILEDGTFEGILGGTINIGSIADALLETGAASETRAVLPFFEANADMNLVDGDCLDMSAAFEFEGTTAFVVRDGTEER